MKLTLQNPKIAELLDGNKIINLCKADVSHIIDIGNGIIVDAVNTGPNHLHDCVTALIKKDNVADALRAAKGVVLFFWSSGASGKADLQAELRQIIDLNPKCEMLIGLDTCKTAHSTRIRAIIVG